MIKLPPIPYMFKQVLSIFLFLSLFLEEEWLEDTFGAILSPSF